jgi:hypothetical protein
VTLSFEELRRESPALIRAIADQVEREQERLSILRFWSDRAVLLAFGDSRPVPPWAQPWNAPPPLPNPTVRIRAVGRRQDLIPARDLRR